MHNISIGFILDTLIQCTCHDCTYTYTCTVVDMDYNVQCTCILFSARGGRTVSRHFLSVPYSIRIALFCGESGEFF